MRDIERRSPYMDYRNVVPFVNLSGFIVNQPCAIETIPAKSLQAEFMRKKMSNMINLRRLTYCIRAEEYRNGRR